MSINRIMCLFFAGALMLCGSVRAETLLVPKHHATVQVAVAAALPGDLILVDGSGGDQAGLVVLDTPGVTVRAVNNAMLLGSFRILADDVSVENWIIETDVDNQGIQFDGVTGATAKNNLILGDRDDDPNDFRGIWVQSSSFCSVKNNTILGHFFNGIGVRGDLTGTEIKNNFLDDNGGCGIKFFDDELSGSPSFGSTVKNNSIRNFTFEALCGDISGHMIGKNFID